MSLQQSIQAAVAAAMAAAMTPFQSQLEQMHNDMQALHAVVEGMDVDPAAGGEQGQKRVAVGGEGRQLKLRVR